MADTLTNVLKSYYDSVPYESHPFPQTAVEHLEAVAFMFGLDAPNPATARVLELGCAAGGNLTPFAARHPAAQATGVDLSSVQVGQGETRIRQASLSNVALKVFNIGDIDASFGEFDYIVCHGVYSWVPPDVQDAILRVCSNNLAPNGVVYVSYNVYPGWKAREIVRDAMILRGGPRESPEEKLSYARGMLDFLEQSAAPNSVLKKTLDETMPLVRTAGGYYLLHDFLEPCNAPCYFKEFVARAEAHDLTYLAEAEPSTMFVQNYAQAVRDPLTRECGGSQIMMEQYLDFLVNRTFRQTLLVKKHRAADIRYRLDGERLSRLEYAGLFKAENGAALMLDTSEQPTNGLRGLKMTLRVPAQKAVALVLDIRYPASIGVDALVAEVATRCGQPISEVRPVVMGMLEELLILGAVRIRRSAVATPAAVSERPEAIASVRMAPSLPLTAGPTAHVCNQWHESTELSMLERCVLPSLDGTRTHDEIAEALAAEARADRLRFIKDDKPVTEPEALREFTRQQVGMALNDLRRKAMLVA